MATIQERYDEAVAAYHTLMTGGGVVTVVDQNGERVEYQTANKSSLSAYIAMLYAQLYPAAARGPLQPWF